MFDADDLPDAFAEAKKLMAEFKVPVVVEVILERVTNISMGTELDNVTEFEELAITGEDAPTADQHARLMRVLIAPDKFKGCLTAVGVAEALQLGLLDERPGAGGHRAAGRRRRRRHRGRRAAGRLHRMRRRRVRPDRSAASGPRTRSTGPPTKPSDPGLREAVEKALG